MSSPQAFTKRFLIYLALSVIETSGTVTMTPINNLSNTPSSEFFNSTIQLVPSDSNLVGPTQAEILTSTTGTGSTPTTQKIAALPTPPDNTNSNSVNPPSAEFPAPTSKKMSIPSTQAPAQLSSTSKGTSSTHYEVEGFYIKITNGSEFIKTMKSVQPAFTTNISDSTLNATTEFPVDFVRWSEEMETDVPCTNPNEDAVLPKVLVGGYNGVYWADETAISLPTLVSRQYLNSYSVDYHYEKHYVFFSAFHKSIIRMNIDNIYPAGGFTVIAKDSGDAQLAVDWVRDQLYWISTKENSIRRANLNGNHNILIYQNSSSDFSYPRNLAVDPYAGYLFFVDRESVFRIYLPNGNKSLEKVEFAMDDPGNITCLALERHKKRVYFSGTNIDTYIASGLYDGKDVHIHNITTSEPWNVIFSMDVYRDNLIVAHYSQQDGDSLLEARLSSSNTSARKIYDFPKTENGIGGIRIYHSNVQSPIDFRTCLEAENEE